MENFQKKINEKTEVCKELLSIFVRLQNNDGSLGVDKDQNLLTHHLILTLYEWDSSFFSDLIDRAVEWFLKIGEMDQHSRDNKSTDFDPFKLIALKTVESKKTKNYLENKYPLLKTIHVRKDGYAVLDLGFRNAQDIADVFPTLNAIDLLLKDNSEDSIKLAKKSIEWVQDTIKANLVYENLSSILGFIALILTKYEIKTKDYEFQEWKNLILDNLIQKQEEGLWENSAYQSSYIFYDIAYIYSINKEVKLIDPLTNFLNKINKDFFKEYQIFGQQFHLVSSSLLRGFSNLFTMDKKDKINNYLKNEAFYYSARLFHREEYLKNSIYEIEKIKDEIRQKNYIPINPKVFVERNFKLEEKKVFVIMPFGKKENLVTDEKIGSKYFSEKDFEKIYSRIIEPAIKSGGLIPERANSTFSSDFLLDKVWTKINEAKIIIAVLTHLNPNVLYEVGISHTLGKPVIIYTEDEQNVPTDLKGIEYVKHKKDFFGEEDNEIEKLKLAINETIKAYGSSEIL